MLQIKDLSICYHDKKVIHNFSFSMKKGEILSLVGESGCGKSTLLRAIMNILPQGAQSTGDILYKGASILHASSAQKNALRGKEIALVFQDAGLSFNPVRRIGKQFIQYIQSHTTLSKQKATLVAIHALEKMHLKNAEQIMQSYSFQLSGGMQQRVGIAMAMALQPELLLLDEPTSALDVTTQAQVVEEILQLHKSQGSSILLITHDIPLAIYMSDYIIIMKKGCIVETGTASQIFHTPKHAYTQQLLAHIPRLEEFCHATT